MKRIKLILFAVCFILCLAVSDASAISWNYDLSQALMEAADKGMPLMVDFYTDWCGWCKKLDADTYSDRTINDTASRFVCVKVNADKYRDLVMKYQVTGYPTIIFLNSNGKVEEKVVGYRDAGALKQIMDKVLSKNPAPKTVATEATAAAILADASQAGPYRLGGIMGNKAIVNNTVVKVGDTIGGATVMQISGGSVKLNSKDKEIILSLQ